MGRVKEARYREPPTPKGLEAIEKGTLDWFDIEMYSNMNTGVLEEYLEEKNRRGAFLSYRWVWWKVIVGFVIGTIFAVISEYVGLKVGMAISGGWYVATLIGLSWKWKPAEINTMSAGADAATMISTGFIFTFPALYLLAYSGDYIIGYSGDKPIHLVTAIPPIWLVLPATIVSGWLGVAYFIVFRRLWLIEDPLHVPGFEPNVKLLEIAKNLTGGAVEQVKRSIRIFLMWFAGTSAFVLLRDFPVFRNPPGSYWYDPKVPMISVLDNMATNNPSYHAGEVMQPLETAQNTFISFAFMPIQLALGWFMRFRVALLMCSGSFLTWFIIVPMATGNHVPIYHITPTFSGMVDVATFPMAALVAWKKVAVPIAIGTLLGGGLLAIIKMLPQFRSVAGDVARAWRTRGTGGESGDYIPKRGWYEWPLMHIPVMMFLVVAIIPALFIMGGYPAVPSFVFALVLIVATFALGAMAIKTMGETGSEPVSATSIIVLMILIGLFYFAFRLERSTAAVFAIIGTTVFCGAISMSGSIVIDFKVALYMGNRPYHMIKAVITGIVPGAVAAVAGASIFAYGLATGIFTLLAPQARVFATLTQIIFSGQSNDIVLTYIAIGIVIGILVELLTGMGTAFGLGMYFPLSIQLPMLLGGALRDIWEKVYLEPKAKAEKWDERRRTLKILDTYMAATGLMVGEALMATVVAMVIVAGGW